MAKEYKVKPLRPNWHYKRGDIYLVNLNPCKGSEQGGIRPAVVVENDCGNYHSPVLIVVPLTTKIKKELLPTHHLVRSRCLREASMALCEAMRPVDKQRILGYIGKLSQADMRNITSCLQTGLGLRSVRNAFKAGGEYSPSWAEEKEDSQNE